MRQAGYSAKDSWYGLAGHRDGEALVQRLLGRVIEHDRTHQTEFLPTLKVYMENQLSAQKVASFLFVHRQTVIYRMGKISELTGLDLAEHLRPPNCGWPSMCMKRWERATTAGADKPASVHGLPGLEVSGIGQSDRTHPGQPPAW